MFVAIAIPLLDKMHLPDMESKQQAPLSAVKELATSLMPRCLVALLSVGRENRWIGKGVREM
jgi:hypothetical protein